MIEKAREAARQTPGGRNRAADFYRTIAILFVVLGHWFLVAPYAPEGQLEVRNILSEQRATQYLTWLFQVMPVFFFVGGFSNAASWASAQRSAEKRQAWATKRLNRLLIPVVPLISLWALAAAIAFQLGVDPDLARDASRAALVPVWFLAVYIAVTFAVPVSFAIWEKIGLRSVAGLAALAIIIDVLGVGAGVGWLRWANYAAVWLAVHQLGYWWWRGDQDLRGVMALFAIGVIWLTILVGPAGYPLSMVSVPGEEISNTRPPTTAMLALGSVQIAILLVLAKPVHRWLQRETPWALVILTARNIMTIYLWHLTVVIVVAGGSLLIGGVGLRTDPGTAAWWTFRPIWVGALIVGLLPFIAIFGRFEAGSRSRRSVHASKIRTYAGTLLSCAGLTVLALDGISSEGTLGINWVPVLLTLLGVFLATQDAGRR